MPQVTYEENSLGESVKVTTYESGHVTRELDRPAPPPAPLRYITRLAFLSRFTDAEAITIDLASIDNPAGTQQERLQQAGMRRYLSKVNNATFIDLDRADTRSGVQALEAGGILAAGRALIILDDPILAHEAYKGT